MEYNTETSFVVKRRITKITGVIKRDKIYNKNLQWRNKVRVTS
jgi:hypothetical protein